MNELGFEMVTRWAPWKDAAGQPAGFVTQWANNVTLATVHGGGHEVRAGRAWLCCVLW
jgi:hypothetical protein